MATFLPRENFCCENTNDITERASYLQEKCEDHLHYCLQQLTVEEQKLQEYYRSLSDSITHQYHEGLHIIRDKKRTVADAFQKHIRAI